MTVMAAVGHDAGEKGHESGSVDAHEDGCEYANEMGVEFEGGHAMRNGNGSETEVAIGRKRMKSRTV